MDEILEVIGLRTSGAEIVVELGNDEGTVSVVLVLSPDEAKTFHLGRTWRNRVTRSSEKKEDSVG